VARSQVSIFVSILVLDLGPHHGTASQALFCAAVDCRDTIVRAALLALTRDSRMELNSCGKSPRFALVGKYRPKKKSDHKS